MYTFQDQQGCQVMLSFERSFSEQSQHVWVICVYEGKWLLTEHKERGLEFPGGKVDEGESLEKAAVREVSEETGAIISSLTYLGQYEVHCKNEQFGKSIYFARITTIEPKDDYFETNGPVLLNDFPSDIKSDGRFSFIMKDDVLLHCLDYIKKRQLI